MCLYSWDFVIIVRNTAFSFSKIIDWSIDLFILVVGHRVLVDFNGRLMVYKYVRIKNYFPVAIIVVISLQNIFRNSFLFFKIKNSMKLIRLNIHGGYFFFIHHFWWFARFHSLRHLQKYCYSEYLFIWVFLLY